MSPRAVGVVLAVVLGAPLGLAACGDDATPFEAYCAEVEQQQTPLTETLAEGGPSSLIAALPRFEALAEVAPDDIRDEWRTVLDAVTALEAALDDAGVDPATYDREQPPEGVTDEQTARIDAAARGLTRPATVTALAGLQQQARDVCKTPLSL